MAHNILGDAARILGQHYGPRVELPAGEWLTLVRLVLGRRGLKRSAPDWSGLEDMPLRRPRETAMQTGSRLEEIVGAAGFASGPVRALPALARWWLQNFDDAD